MESQNKVVLKHLKNGPITVWDAIRHYRIMRLAARIDDLRHAGHNIITHLINQNGKRYAEYHLIKKRGSV